MIKSIFLFIFVSIYGITQEKAYFKDYYQNNNIKSEGWLMNNKKVDYWFFYNENGSKKEEGHYKNNNKVNWWIYYNYKNEIIKKCEFLNDKMNGLCIIYDNGNIIRAEKYIMGQKIKQWNSISEYKKDNLLSYTE